MTTQHKLDMLRMDDAAVRHWVAHARHPVVLFMNGLGDHILNLPSLRALAAMFPHQLTLIAGSGTGEVFFADLPLRAIVETPTWVEDGRRHFDVDEVVAAVGPCDLFLSQVPWCSASTSALLARLRPRLSVGFFDEFDVVLPRLFDKHSADMAFDLPRRLDPTLTLERYSAPPALSADAARCAHRLRALMPPGVWMLAVHADTAHYKMWSVEQWTCALDTILHRHERCMVMVVGETPQSLDQGTHGDRVVFCYGLPLATSFWIVAQADLFVGVDSCMLHVADIFGVPGVGLFGPKSRSDEFGFRWGPHRHVVSSMSMEDIAVHAVVAAVDDMLREHPPGTTTARWARP